MTTVLITGATRGLGRAAALAVARRGAHVLIAGRSTTAVHATATEVGGEPVIFDLERLDSVRQAALELPTVDVVALNAGLQVVTGATRTPDGFESTFQVNHLAQLLLLDALLARPEPPRRVVLTGSGTHDGDRRTGMPAPLEGAPGVWAYAVDEAEEPGEAGRRRYTTSKLLNAATAEAVARERPDVHVTCFDPGLMLATGLSRQYPPLARRLPTLLAPALGVLLPFASTPLRSGDALSRLLLDDPPPAASGAYVDFRLRSLPAAARARDRSSRPRCSATAARCSFGSAALPRARRRGVIRTGRVGRLRGRAPLSEARRAPRAGGAHGTRRLQGPWRWPRPCRGSARA